MSWALRVEGLSKRYRIGTVLPRYRTLGESLLERFRAAREVPASVPADIWALKDVSFQVERGDVVGILGGNGAGKSTLLKVLSRITAPTRGSAEIRGRLGTLLEIGTGFHPELTGRENIYLSGSILGMKRAEIAARFDEIVGFSEMGRFLDTPLKHYSSGMSMRLAFAVASHLDTEILFVDEVLAVGDLGFQRKCLNKMQDLSRSGRTIMFVSHNLQAVASLTNHAILLRQGHCLFYGPTAEALHRYRSEFQQGASDAVYKASLPPGGTGLRSAKVITSEAGAVHKFGEPLRLEFELQLESCLDPDFSFKILDDSDMPVVRLWARDVLDSLPKHGLIRISCVLPRPRLYVGPHFLSVELAGVGFGRQSVCVDRICRFEVTRDDVAGRRVWSPGECAYSEEAQWALEGGVHG